MKDQVLLLLTGIAFAAMAWAFFRYLGEYGLAIFFVFLLGGHLYDNHRIRKDIARIKEKLAFSSQGVSVVISVVRLLAILWVFALASSAALAKPPDCTSPEAWPAGMAFTHLKNAGVVTNDALDFKKTTVTRLASEKIGKDLYRQVHLIRFFKISGESIQAIAVNEVSNQECSMSNVDVYLVSSRLGDYSQRQ
jgi:hypothetical protein